MQAGWSGIQCTIVSGLRKGMLLLSHDKILSPEVPGLPISRVLRRNILSPSAILPANAEPLQNGILCCFQKAEMF